MIKERIIDRSGPEGERIKIGERVK